MLKLMDKKVFTNLRYVYLFFKLFQLDKFEIFSSSFSGSPSLLYVI